MAVKTLHLWRTYYTIISYTDL